MKFFYLFFLYDNTALRRRINHFLLPSPRAPQHPGCRHSVRRAVLWEEGGSEAEERTLTEATCLVSWSIGPGGGVRGVPRPQPLARAGPCVGRGARPRHRDRTGVCLVSRQTGPRSTESKTARRPTQALTGPICVHSCACIGMNQDRRSVRGLYSLGFGVPYFWSGLTGRRALR
jgi:hypothetical protein